MMRNENHTIEELEIRLLIDGIYELYGYDFRDYAQASLKRRIWKSVQSENLDTVSSFQNLVFHDRNAMERFLLSISVDVTSFFRDPATFKKIRTLVLPGLYQKPHLRIWHAGCAAGQEVPQVRGAGRQGQPFLRQLRGGIVMFEQEVLS